MKIVIIIFVTVNVLYVTERIVYMFRAMTL